MEFTYRDIAENEKNLTTVSRIYSELLAAKAGRNDTLIAIGGGATLDTVGFAAATYKRGMRWIACPTTLLAMVDAGIGGKTGVNLDGVKNAIGAFYPPSETRIDVRQLLTLDRTQILSGLGEMLKHGLLDSEEHLSAVMALMDSDITESTLPTWQDAITHSRAVKQRIIDIDPLEHGPRRSLNLGHTVGHALEALSLSGSSPLPHGYAVVYGLIAELYLSHVLLGLDKLVVSRISHLIPEYYPRPNVSCRRYEELFALMQQDKKGPLNFTLLRAIGHPILDQTASRDQIYEALDYLFSL